jgi:hypothetical protein
MLTGISQSADVVVAARKTTYFHLVDPLRSWTTDVSRAESGRKPKSRMRAGAGTHSVITGRVRDTESKTSAISLESPENLPQISVREDPPNEAANFQA